MLVFAEIGYTVNRRENLADSGGLMGTYKLGAFIDSKEFPDKSGEGSSHDGNYSIYFIVDQELWRPPGDARRVLSLFARVGFAPEPQNTVHFYLDSGLHFEGLITGRDQDILGLGFSYTRLSSNLRDEFDRRIARDYEAILELTYRVALGEHLSLQPDLQCIFNPGAVAPAKTAVVAGIRTNISF